MRTKPYHRYYIVLFATIVLITLAANPARCASYKAIDLNPSGFSESHAYGNSGTQQVGYGFGIN